MSASNAQVKITIQNINLNELEEYRTENKLNKNV